MFFFFFFNLQYVSFTSFHWWGQKSAEVRIATFKHAKDALHKLMAGLTSFPWPGMGRGGGVNPLRFIKRGKKNDGGREAAVTVVLTWVFGMMWQLFQNLKLVKITRGSCKCSNKFGILGYYGYGGELEVGKLYSAKKLLISCAYINLWL